MSDQPSDPPAAQPGGQIGNANGIVHGLRCKRHGLVHAKLGKKFAGAYADVCRLRRELERLVTAKYGSFSLIQRAKVQTIARVEEGIRACELMIRNHQDLGPEEVRQQREAIHRWTRERDKLLASLLGNDNGEASGTDPWSALDHAPSDAPREPQGGRESDPAVQDDSEPKTATSSAADGGRERQTPADDERTD